MTVKLQVRKSLDCRVKKNKLIKKLKELQSLSSTPPPISFICRSYNLLGEMIIGWGVQEASFINK